MPYSRQSDRPRWTRAPTAASSSVVLMRQLARGLYDASGSGGALPRAGVDPHDWRAAAAKRPRVVSEPPRPRVGFEPSVTFCSAAADHRHLPPERLGGGSA
jgi:hypothetical protein